MYASWYWIGGATSSGTTDSTNGMLFYYSGVSATYTTLAGVASTITVLVGKANDVQTEDESGRHIERMRRVTVALADVADPTIGDSVTVGGEVWAVQTIVDKGSELVQLDCIRREAAEVSRRGHRQR